MVMKIVFASNYLNHHERFFCEALDGLKGVEFKFIQTLPLEKERINLGWQDFSALPYCICSYSSEQAYHESLQMCRNADVLILGGAPNEFVEYRVKNNKLTFYYAERLFHDGLWHMLNPRTFMTVLKRFIIPGNKSNFYMLCASGYTALDCHKIFAFRKKYFRWGHFIEVKHFDSVDSLLESKRLKHPDLAIAVAERLRKQGYKYEMNIIGTGELEESLKNEVIQKNLADSVHFLGSMKPTEVRSYMESSDIYIFTSDFSEGWGAVLGEAMASGCAVVTSHGIGATPFLANHKENALVYETGNVDSLYHNVKKLMDSEDLRTKFSRNAIDTMQNFWNAKVGAERFYNVVRALINEEPVSEYENGPMSKAALLKNNWFKDDTV